MSIYFNPLDTRCKSVTGGIRQNEKVTFHVFGDSVGPCLLVLTKDGGEARYFHMQNTGDGWETSIQPDETGLYFYYFVVNGRKAGLGKYRNLIVTENVVPYQILVYKEDFETPDWFKGGIMYQIFPDRFYRHGNTPIQEGKILHERWNENPEFRKNENGKILNNDFFGGNLQGILQKLDYLSDLHINVIYLNPIFQSYSNHRYDTGDYLEIDPLLGSKDDFAKLIEECDKRGIKIILDGVFNHTGDDSRYFNKYGHYDDIGAYQSKDSKYYAWYKFENFPDKYDCWWGIDILPAVNEDCESFVDFIAGKHGVLQYWMGYGIGGFRLDVADELPDEFIEKIRIRLKSASRSDRQAVLIGEVWEDASNKIAYGKRRKYFQGSELDSVMNYPLKDAIIQFVQTSQTDLLRETIYMLIDNYPKCVLDSLMNILGTHDTERILTVFGNRPAKNKEEMNLMTLSPEDRATAVKKLKVAAILQYTLFGIPCVYYGDEAGTEGYADPFCRKTFNWEHIDEDLLFFYQKLGQLRSSLKLFKDSNYREFFSDKNCLVFERRNDKEQIIVAVNLGNNRFDIHFHGILYDVFTRKKYLNVASLQENSWLLLSNMII